MNDEPQYSRGVVMAATAWAVTGLVLLMAWSYWALGDPEHIHLAVLIAETACVLSALAAVLHIRCYAARICRLIRMTSGGGDRYRDDDGGVRQLPRR